MKKWYQLALLNLMILASLGLILRYKINFPLEILQQKNILYAHSHFAFNGWVSFLLQIVILDEFTSDYQENRIFWDRFLVASSIVNYCMIVSFVCVGYTAISIVFSTLALWLSYVFVYKVFKALPAAGNSKISVAFIKTSLWFLLLSSIGPYALGLIIIAKSNHEYWSHNALYFFLHFQYNGWFTFAVFAFLMKKLERSDAFNIQYAQRFFILLALTCIPAYLFTSLWHHRPLIVTIIIIITAVLQTISLYYLLQLLYKNAKHAFAPMPIICRWLYSMAILAFIPKILLQFFSAHPQVGQLAFTYRPIIIGYLHLIFLGFITMYLLGVITDKKIIMLTHRISWYGLITFISGIIINELLLATQGFAAISYLFLPWVNLALFYNTITLFAGAIFLFVAAKKNDGPPIYIFRILQ